MVLSKLTENELRKMITAASQTLQQNAEFINSLNVFPVPDGDTGTNMSLTFASGAKYVQECTEDSVGALAQALAKGLLMGARGNSGVILSQIFRGFHKTIDQQVELDAMGLAKAIQGGVKTAYKAVMKPQEGTILTVARCAAQAAFDQAKQSNDVVLVLKATYEAAKKALATTPDLLPVLKEVGVVDSGGQGLTFVYQGFYEAVTGKVSAPATPNQSLQDMVAVEHHKEAQSQLATADIEYGYCTEIMVKLGDAVEAGRSDFKQFDYDQFRNHLAEIGNSLLVIADDEVVKVHVHTNQPGSVLAYGQEFGALVKVKVDNMRLQHETIVQDVAENNAAPQAPVSAPAEPMTTPTGDYGIVAVASGAGLEKLFKELGVSVVVSGGQTMNPSTADLLAAINKTNAKKVLVLPNNKNIFMAAQAAAEEADVECSVIPTKTVTQGLTALVSFNAESDMATNQSEMTDSLANVASGSVTVAVRDTVIDGTEIKKDNYLGIVDGKIVATKPDCAATALAMVKAMLDEDSEIVTVIYGADATKEDADKLVAAISELDDELEFEVHEGDQPVYPYLIAVE